MEKVFAINNRKKQKKLVSTLRNTFHIGQRTIPRWGGSLQKAQRPLFHLRGSYGWSAQRQRQVYVKKPECPARKSGPTLKGGPTPKGRGDEWPKWLFL
jgi:hypothetical protein